MNDSILSAPGDIRRANLLAINVNDRVEKKGNLTYLSWAWAWAEVLKIDECATWYAHEFNGLPVAILPDNTAMVKVSVVIDKIERTSWLPVMDHKNKAIVGPDSFSINTAIMRALAKAIAMHGLGLYIYAGEDLPPMDDAQKAALDKLVADMVQLHYEEKNIVQSVKLWYDNEQIQSSNEAREYCWSELSDYSALRSSIKANKPDLKAVAGFTRA